jgi:hypothetical protein
MKDIYHNYCDPNRDDCVAKFLTIYIAEAHAKDEWYLPTAPNAHEGGHACIIQHKNIESRKYVASTFIEDFDIPFEVVCDSMKDQVCERYDAWPERVYIIEKGMVVYAGGLGPFDYKLAEVKDWLASRYGLRGDVITRR